jgi:hypothetical protein
MPSVISNSRGRNSVSLQRHSENFPPEMKDLIDKIVGSRAPEKIKHSADIDWSKHQSTMSKKLLINKNIQNKMFIKCAQPNGRFIVNKDRM